MQISIIKIARKSRDQKYGILSLCLVFIYFLPSAEPVSTLAAHTENLKSFSHSKFSSVNLLRSRDFCTKGPQQ